VSIAVVKSSFVPFVPKGIPDGSVADKPVLTTLSDGNFVFAYVQNGSVFAQKLDAAGNLLGSELNLSGFALLIDEFDIAAVADGGFVVSYTGGFVIPTLPPADGSGTGIFSSVVSADGAVSAFKQVNTTTTGDQENSALAVLSNGNIVVAFEDASQTLPAGNGDTIRFRILDKNGLPTGSDVIAAGADGDQSFPDIVALSDGGFMLVYQDGSPLIDSSAQSTAILAQRFSATGAEVGSQIRVNTITSGDQHRPSAIVLKNGDLVFAWRDESLSSDAPNETTLRMRIFDQAGNGKSADLRIPTDTVHDMKSIKLAALDNGFFVAAWAQDFSAGDQLPQAQVFTADGQPVGDAIDISAGAKTGDIIKVDVAALAGGKFVVSWSDPAKFEAFASIFDSQKQVATGSSDKLVGSNLDETLQGLAGVDDLSGNGGNDLMDGGDGVDALSGGNGNDRLDGGTNIDIMSGGAGNDRLLVDHANDVTNGGTGLDVVESRVSRVLDSSSEQLILTGTAAKGTGNGLVNVLTGNTAANTLLGLAGNDTLAGGKGNDILDGGKGADRMKGENGNDRFLVDNLLDRTDGGAGIDQVDAKVSCRLDTTSENLFLFGSATTGTGNALANAITGNAVRNTLLGLNGNDRLDGGLGKDTLIGGNGSDSFLFTTKLSALNVDKIDDFAAVDVLRLDNAVFSGLSLGTLKAKALAFGTAAADGDDRIIYDQGSGKLFFDADGAGTKAAIQFAQVDAGTVMTHADFIAF
jgi:Ca2+-binding RTX toxin-like protein